MIEKLAGLAVMFMLANSLNIRHHDLPISPSGGRNFSTSNDRKFLKAVEKRRKRRKQAKRSRRNRA